jgi:PfaD family protein
MVDASMVGNRSPLRPIGQWLASQPPVFSSVDIGSAAARVREPVQVVRDPHSGHMGLASGGSIVAETQPPREGAYELMASLPALYPEWLGDRTFHEAHGVRFPYVAGAMANGIATPQMVVEMGRAGMLGVYGAAGLSPARVESGIEMIRDALEADGFAWGVNLIHSPNEPQLEAELVDLFLRQGVHCVSASAFMKLTLPLVRYACSGLTRDAKGRIHRPNQVLAKVSRVEVARHFMAPAPEAMLRKLVERGELTESEAKLASQVPVAEDITAEADSGGHTDRRPLTALLPAVAEVRDKLSREHGYSRPIRIGAAGGLGTPSAVASAFSLGAAYVLTGSINQAAVESGLSQAGKEMLADADTTDVAMAPSADMFEIGAQVQVLSRGTMFAARARKLDDYYRRLDSLDGLSSEEQRDLEDNLLGDSVEAIWEKTRSFWQERDPAELERAQTNPRHKMALLFRWYLGNSSHWAIAGSGERRFDYQIWCGPAMGAFNRWTADTFLADPANRGVVQIARNLLEGAAVVTRAHQLRTYGLPVPTQAFDFRARPLK